MLMASSARLYTLYTHSSFRTSKEVTKRDLERVRVVLWTPTVALNGTHLLVTLSGRNKVVGRGH
jgi:hypothetical protein